MLPPTMLSMARARGFSTGTVYSWDWFSNLISPSSVDLETMCADGDDVCVCETVLGWIEKGLFPQYSFVYFGSIDEAGHAYGWGSDEYYTAVRAVDVHIGKILDALKKTDMLNSILIATTADHGGFGRDHGGFDQANMETPVIYTNFGNNRIKRGYINEIHSNVRFLPTCLHAMGWKETLPGYFATPLNILNTPSVLDMTEVIVQ